MIIGYQFINANGYPIGNVQPTLEDAERVARFREFGWFYSIEQTEHGQLVMRYHSEKKKA